jgi:hypothetical protein
MSLKLIPSVLVGLLAIVLHSCGQKSDTEFEVRDFHMIKQGKKFSEVYKTTLDYEYAIDSGFIIPTYKNDGFKYFVFSFTVRNNSSQRTDFAYRIYYQNETYKFDELSDDAELVQENFYGSWEQEFGEFHVTPEIDPGKEITVIDSIRITGNPRSEEKYAGLERKDKYIPQVRLDAQINHIRNDKAWFSEIEKKAAQNGISVESQLREDAVYIINLEREKNKINQRWKRNPRVGNYDVMLVVTSKETAAGLPDDVKSISARKEDLFLNPFSYFTPGKSEFQIIRSPFLQVAANIPVGNGIYFNKNYYKDLSYKRTDLSASCSDDSSMFHQAAFEHYIHQIGFAGDLNNVPAVADVQGNQFGVEDYQKIAATPDDKRIKKPVSVTDCPCSNVSLSDDRKSLLLINRGSSIENPQKQNTGLVTRHGMTYGKFRIKVLLPNLLNQSGMWNGLTNAIWMINEDAGEWNNRRLCKKDGYLKRSDSGNKEAPRNPYLSYSEIDFEIVKASSDWPETSYNIPNPGKRPAPLAPDEIVITCTNWDMACGDPDQYHVGAKDFDFNGKINTLHRWDHWYTAITAKVPFKDAEIFGKEYYFEIEWRPKEIIWRIGDHPDKMKEVARMNDSVTSIPNNQMVMVVTQEFHLSDWWPGQPFSQNDVPFPAKDIVGKVLELTVE